ncbi:hypothetical protein [Brevibacillus laterosporus]|uniref:hypothetical protein n=1 Tax=Brevibacillus laterosporus TaxID=1465 RepID=UPI001C3EA610|nr:hypothetical protein [Brevibacillus laterosporus]
MVPTNFTHIDQITTSGKLATIYNNGPAVEAGWSVDFLAPRLDIVATHRLIQVDVALAVRDIDGFLHGVDYQINAVGF